MNVRERWRRYPQEIGIAVDQVLNALIPPFFTLSWSDETVSARLYRAHRRGRIVGLMLMPMIDLLFVWQAQDAEVNAAAGMPITGHCQRAFWKEKLRRGLPPEYREVQP